MRSLKSLTNKDVQINIFEIKRPELDARLLLIALLARLKLRINHRRAVKMAIQRTMRLGAEGIRLTSQVVLTELRLLVLKHTRKVEFLYTLSVLTSTTLT